MQQFNTAEQIHKGGLYTARDEFSIHKCSWSSAKKPACCEYTTKNANVLNKGLTHRQHTNMQCVSSMQSVCFLLLSIIQYLPDLDCICQLHGSSPIYAEYIGIQHCSQTRQQAGWLHGWLTFNVNSRLMLRATVLRLSNDNSRVGYKTSVIMLSAKRNVIIAKLLLSAAFTEQSNKQFYCQATW